MRIFAELQEKIKYSTNSYTVFEIEMIKICTPQMEKDYSSLYERIFKLEQIVESLLKKSPENFNMDINYDEFITITRKPCQKRQLEVYYI